MVAHVLKLARSGWEHPPGEIRPTWPRREVDSLFALVATSLRRGQVEKLTPSLLARAFAGQLVPQDPADEPAEKLLQRLQAANKKRKGVTNNQPIKTKGSIA